MLPLLGRSTEPLMPELVENTFWGMGNPGSHLLSPEGMTETCFVNGLLTASAIGPKRPRPHDWIPIVLGDTAAQQSYEFLNMVNSTLALLYNQVVSDLRLGRDLYEPGLYRQLDAAESSQHDALCGAWADGFRQGMSLDSVTWRAFNATDQGRVLLTPWAILLLAGRGELDHRRQDLEAEDMRRYALLELPASILKIKDHWARGRTRPAQRISLNAKIGRNDPCPCASGRKYKKCCGE